MIGAVAEETRMCCCKSAIKIQINKREDRFLVNLLLQTWSESHAACYENFMDMKPVEA